MEGGRMGKNGGKRAGNTWREARRGWQTIIEMDSPKIPEEKGEMLPRDIHVRRGVGEAGRIYHTEAGEAGRICLKCIRRWWQEIPDF
jgi:hypothetical protein